MTDLIENHIVYDVHMFDSLSKFSNKIYFCVFRITGSVVILRHLMYDDCRSHIIVYIEFILSIILFIIVELSIALYGCIVSSIGGGD